MSAVNEFSGSSEHIGRDRSYPFSSPVIAGIYILIDSLIILAAGFVVQFAYVGWRQSSADFYVAAIFLVATINFMMFRFGGLYDFAGIMRPFDMIDKMVVSFMTSFMLLLATAFSLKVSEEFSRVWLYGFAASASIAVIGWRIGSFLALAKLSDMGVIARRVVIVGTGEQAQRLLSRIKQNRPRFMKIAGIFDERNGDRAIGQAGVGQAGVGGYPVLGDIEQLLGFVRHGRVNDVIIALPWSADERIAALIEKLRELPVNIYLGADLAGLRFNLRSTEGQFESIPLAEISEKPMSGWSVILKAIEDYILAFASLVLLAPLLVVTAIAIKLDSPGPILFRQKRLGFNNRGFSIYKFRSMRHESELVAKTLQATKGDPRLTRVGAFIRRTSIDELPQLLNVLSGTMSLVGPRPHAVDHNEEYSQRIRGYFGRHRVKPGITGWAQVNGLRGETRTLEQMEGRVQHDIYYTENWSVLFDIRILIMTVFTVLFGKNAY